MKKALWLILAVGLGVAAGLGLTFRALEWPPHFGVVKTGSWITRPGVGSTSADPYSKALMAYRGEIPMGAAEGVMLTATTDDDGRTLHSACTYVVRGNMPAAGHWTIAVYRSTGVGASDVRQSYTSTEALMAEDGNVSLLLSPDPQPGNWIPLVGSAPITLVLRLYETQVSSSALALDKVESPIISRIRCR